MLQCESAKLIKSITRNQADPMDAVSTIQQIDQIDMLSIADENRLKANTELDEKNRGKLGQFMTPAPVAELLASFYDSTSGDIKLLDAGAGVGSLTAAFCKSALDNGLHESINVTAFEIDPVMINYLQGTLADCSAEYAKRGKHFESQIEVADFIESAVNRISANNESDNPILFNKAILNPPYLKIAANSFERKLCKKVGVDSGNLYSCFVGLAIKLLEDGGELVAITPRSFCNGPYFTAFRNLILSETAITKIRVFESRTKAFKGDDVLQENIVFHLVKGGEQGDVEITQSDCGEDEQITRLSVPFNDVVYENDPNQFIHVITNQADLEVAELIGGLPCTLNQLDMDASTGRVVDFRVRKYSKPKSEKGTVPFIFPVHFDNGIIKWPALDSKKPNSIEVAEKTNSLLVPDGNYVITRRMSSKEEQRRVVAAIYESDKLGFDKVGFDNKTNFFHSNGQGLDRSVARGIYAYISCTVVDQYFRTFNGHTQVNATDLRFIRYPSLEVLIALGQSITDQELTDFARIDALVEELVFGELH